MKSLEITKGMFDAVEQTHRALLEECAETVKNLFEKKGCVFVKYLCNLYEFTGNKRYYYEIWIESLYTHKYFDTWLEMVDWIARFEILMRRFDK